jgi:hypothetical protein
VISLNPTNPKIDKRNIANVVHSLSKGIQTGNTMNKIIVRVVKWQWLRPKKELIFSLFKTRSGINMKVAVNEFVRRQIKGSGKTYAESLQFETIAKHAQSQMEKGFFTEGYRDGVRVVQCTVSMISKFTCPFVKLDEHTELVSKRVRRIESEAFYIQTRAKNGMPLKSAAVDLILYRHDVLIENNENTTNADWELISINAIPEGIDKFPMGPVTMMRNQLELSGGTKAYYSSDSWAESVQFWQKFVALEPEK